MPTVEGELLLVDQSPEKSDGFLLAHQINYPGEPVIFLSIHDQSILPPRIEQIRYVLKAGDSVRFRLLVSESESWIDLITRTEAQPVSAVPVIAPASVVKPRHPLMNTTFTNELNQPVRLADLQGKALAITFFFTRCPIPEYCPRLSKNFEAASRKLGAMTTIPTNWHFLSVSFDGAFDTPAVLKAYGERYHADPQRWSFWTGAPEQVAELARLSDVTFTKGPEGFFDHNFRTLIIDPAGKLQMTFPVGGDLSEAIVSEILKALSVTNRPT